MFRRSVWPALRRFVWLAVLFVMPMALTACPDDDTSLEEGVEEVGDEVDDATN